MGYMIDLSIILAVLSPKGNKLKIQVLLVL